MGKALLHELGRSISFGRLSLKAKVLWPMLLASSDNQGRGQAAADVIMWHVCPNVEEIAVDEIPGLLQEMAEQDMLMLYRDSRGRELYQLLHWWDYQRLQFAQPSLYEAPEGWTDRIRYTVSGRHIKTNWDTPGGFGVEASESPGGEPGGGPPGEPGGGPNQTKPKETKSNQRPPHTPPSGVGGVFSLETWLKVYRENIGRVRPKARERIAAWFGDPHVDFALWDEAIGIAMANNNRKLAYIEGVIRNRLGPNGDDPEASVGGEMRLVGELPGRKAQDGDG